MIHHGFNKGKDMKIDVKNVTGEFEHIIGNGDDIITGQWKIDSGDKIHLENVVHSYRDLKTGNFNMDNMKPMPFSAIIVYTDGDMEFSKSSGMIYKNDIEFCFEHLPGIAKKLLKYRNKLTKTTSIV